MCLKMTRQYIKLNVFFSSQGLLTVSHDGNGINSLTNITKWHGKPVNNHFLIITFTITSFIRFVWIASQSGV
jgi:hypothetical protein